MFLHLVCTSTLVQTLAADIVTGLNILSTYIGGDDANATISGTSAASSHTAGLLAYLLSIYPSPTFDPISKIPPPVLPYASFYSFCHTVLPHWVIEFLPSLRWFLTVPIASGPAEISPMELKRALLDLSSKGMLTGIPPETQNLLIFNNITA